MKRTISASVLAAVFAAGLAGMLVSCGALGWGGGVKIKPEGRPYIGTPSEITGPEQTVVGVPVEIAVEYYETYTLKLIDVKTSLNGAAQRGDESADNGSAGGGVGAG